MDSPDPDPFLVAAMSFQNLISGAECAAPANPLSQVLKHTEGDRSLQQVKAVVTLRGTLELNSTLITGQARWPIVFKGLYAL